MATAQMQEENDKLKKQLHICQKQVAHYKKQLNELQKQIESNNDHKSAHHNHKKPQLHPKHRKTENIVTSISKNDAKNALMARFAAKKNPPKPQENQAIERSMNRNAAANALLAKFGAKKATSKPKENQGIERSVNRNDAANALLSKFAALKKPKPAASNASTPNKKAIFKKYEIMMKVGVDLSGVLTQMKKDNLDKALIAEFNKSHGGSDASGDNKEETDPLKLGLPQKPRIKAPKQSMKRLHWTPVKLQKIMLSIWNKVDQQWADYKTLSFELKFQTRTQKPKLSNDALKHNVNDAEHKKQEQVKFVSGKRSQQVQIGLRSYHMTNNELRKMILLLDDTKLDMDNLIGLIDIIPSPEEQLAAEKASQDNNTSNFGVAERFFYSLYDIIELVPRIKKWVFKLQFDQKVDHVEEQMVLLEKSKIAITHSQSLKDVLSILLAFGNHMNYGNKLKGNCYGFHLTDLTLLPQIKTFDNSMTFPMFLYDFIEKNNPKLLHMFDELSIVAQACSIDIDTVEKQYDELKNELKDLDLMIDRYKEEYFEVLSDEDLFLKKMSKFQNIARKRMWALKFKYDSLHKCQKHMKDYFAYDSDAKSVTMTKILKDLQAFIVMLQSSKSKLGALEQQRKKREAQRLRDKKRKRRNSNTILLNKSNANIVSHKKKQSRQFPICLEDIGTPLARNTPHKHAAAAASQQVTFSSLVIGINSNPTKAPPSRPPSTKAAKAHKQDIVPPLNRSTTYSNLNYTNKTSDLPSLARSGNNSIKMMKPKPRRNAPTLSLNNLHIKVRRGSDPTTPVTPSLSPKKRRNKAKGRNMNAIGLMSSDCKLTPCGAMVHANADASFDVIIPISPKKRNRRKINTKKLKTTSDISAVRNRSQMMLKNRATKKKLPSYKKIPGKKLPKTPMKVTKKSRHRNY